MLFLYIMILFPAYCLATELPPLPQRSSMTKTETLHVPGQVVTYQCHTGYEFVGDPVAVSISPPVTTTTAAPATTTTAISWVTFEGAEYAKGTEQADVTWTQARARCQRNGGDLASIESYFVMWKIKEFGTSDDAWIGATDSATEGTWAWADSLAWAYTNWDTCVKPTDDNSKNCGKIEAGKSGRWNHEDCDATGIRSYICKKGSSAAPMWKDFHGAEYMYVRHDTCIISWNRAKLYCESFGGSLASIVHADIVTSYTAYYGASIDEEYWIGLTDQTTEGEENP